MPNVHLVRIVIPDDDNDGLNDIAEFLCAPQSTSSTTFNSKSQQWQSSGKTLVAGSVYTLLSNGSSLGTATVSGGPNDGEEVTVVQFAADRFVDLDGYGYYYNGNSYEHDLRNPRPIGFANLTGSEYNYLLTFVGMIDVNGNGQYDAGTDQIIPRLFLENNSILQFLAEVSGEFYIVFTDAFYSDNAGDLTFSVEECVSVDTDNDGVDDYLDSDSDNDGCYDVIENGFTDER